MRAKKIPAEERREEHRVSNSRFIAIGRPVHSVESAREFIAEIRREFPDATHWVPAYIVGSGQTEISHCNDDGEPSGTAGRPILSLLQSEGWTDIAVVVVRYFGGTKLGTGGLVRAYSQSVKKLLSSMPIAQKIRAIRINLIFPYHLYQKIENLLLQSGAEIEHRDFAHQVSLTALIPETEREKLFSQLKNLRDVSIRIIKEQIEILRKI